jgi:hypothetical protein
MLLEHQFVLQLVLEQIDTLQTLCNLSKTCRATYKLLTTKPCDEQWMVAARKICGRAYWTDAFLSGQPHIDDKRYTAKLRICPWLTIPRKITPNLVGKLDKSEDRVGHVYFYRAPKKLLPAGLELKIRNAEYAMPASKDDTFHAILTNPRPFGLQFELQLNFTQEKPEDLEMFEHEKEILEQIQALPIPAAYTDGKTFTRVTRIHDGAVAAQFEGEGACDWYSAHLFIFATKPTLRLIHHIQNPADFLEDKAFFFGLGEMWVSGTECMDEISGIYYFGPRRDKRVKKTKHFATATQAFWAASTGNFDEAVAILRSKRLRLTTHCTITGYTILHYAVRGNNLPAVRSLVLNYKMSPDSDTYICHHPINVAARYGFEPIVDFLAAQGAKGSSWSKDEWKYPREGGSLKLLQQRAESDLGI